MSQKRNLAVVAGNGLSISYSRELVLGTITRTLIEDLGSLAPGDDTVLLALRNVADRIDPGEEISDDDFERIIGAFETQASLIGQLESLVGLVADADDDLKESLRKSADFAKRINEIGTGIALHTILTSADLSETDIAHMDQFYESMAKAFAGQIAFGNLNYDPLAMRSMLRLELPFCDMADARQEATIKVVNEEDDGTKTTVAKYTGRLLRKTPDFPDMERYRIRLLHLHGSVLFWRKKSTGEIVKIPLGPVRRFELLNENGKQRMSWEPAVVLANTMEKPDRVLEPPFYIGYEALREGLQASDHWLIVGYSFKDTSVNSLLSELFMDRKVKPKVLVSTFGDLPERVVIERALGWSADDPSSDAWLAIERNGAEKLHASEPWSWFISS